ncbi:MAG: hypothetical protein CVU29_02550 [Betaproteobacteria bacterium HGW-Betaproteobacteria-22]|nr:MAG: hypothetical protein CVU29_02550 [Betaproteobacteria bacterium HGW-Betaproteobacteria-22]
MTHPCATKSAGGFMAGFARCGGLHVIAGLTCRFRTVVAVRTSGSDACMVHRSTTKGTGGFMAGLASRSGLYVITRFTLCG